MPMYVGLFLWPMFQLDLLLLSKVLGGKSEGKRLMEDLGVGGRIILK
jgi:hypothetical protein